MRKIRGPGRRTLDAAAKDAKNLQGTQTYRGAKAATAHMRSKPTAERQQKTDRQTRAHTTVSNVSTTRRPPKAKTAPKRLPTPPNRTLRHGRLLKTGRATARPAQTTNKQRQTRTKARRHNEAANGATTHSDTASTANEASKAEGLKCITLVTSQKHAASAAKLIINLENRWRAHYCGTG